MLLVWAGALRAGEPLKFGVAPHTSARVVLAMYQPLRLHLEQALGQPVAVETATDFTEFGQRLLQGQYDLAVTTSHQARLAQTEVGYLPLLTYQADFKAVALVTQNSPYQQAADLKGTVVLGLSPSSLVTLWGQHWLRQNGVEDVSIRYVSAADSVSRQLQAGDVAAAFTSLANYQKLQPDIRGDLRILAESMPMPGRIYVLSPKHAALQEPILAALWSFVDSPAGRDYMTTNKLVGYRALNPEELPNMDPYAAETRKVLMTQ